MMSDVVPGSFTQRSLTYHVHESAVFSDRNSASVVESYTHFDSVEQLKSCALLDLSELSRTGVRGPGAEAFLTREGIAFPHKPNLMIETEQRQIVARLGSSECWVLDDPVGPGREMGALNTKIDEEPGCYPLYCQHSHAWFALSGKYLPELMAKICGVDLRADAFPEGAIVQTSIARVSGIIIHHKVNGIPLFSLLSDSSSSEYLWHALLDAMQEFAGKPVGLNVLKSA